MNRRLLLIIAGGEVETHEASPYDVIAGGEVETHEASPYDVIAVGEMEMHQAFLAATKHLGNKTGFDHVQMNKGNGQRPARQILIGNR